MGKEARDVKLEIIEKVKEYFELEHKCEPFIPTQSKVPYAARVYNSDELVNLVDSSLEFWITYGRYSKQFEEDFSKYLGVRSSSLVNSGSSANLLAVASLKSHLLGKRKLVPGDEVITVAAAFPTTVAPIIQQGLVPVFVDVSIPTYNVDCSQLELALSPKSKAVMLAHTLGNPFDISSVKAFCQKNDLWLIEDNCDALGSLYKGKLTGTFGDIGTSSFYPPHHITMGEGGAVYTDNPIIDKVVTSLRDWGRDCTCPSGKDNTCERRFSQQFGNLPFGYDHKYVYSHFGYNLKVSDMQAAIGCAQLKKLPGFVELRRKHFAFLYDSLQELREELIFPEATENTKPSWFGFPMTVKKDAGFSRDDIVAFLEKQKIQTRTLFSGNLLQHPCFDEMRSTGTGYRVIGDLKNTDTVMSDTFWVGVYPGLTESMLLYISQQIKTFVLERKR